jgi:hypothetical protein
MVSSGLVITFGGFESKLVFSRQQPHPQQPRPLIVTVAATTTATQKKLKSKEKLLKSQQRTYSFLIGVTTRAHTHAIWLGGGRGLFI